MITKSKNYCVIMAGGIGSRFWPMSTQKFPKQFQDILGTGRTMIRQTYDRISKLIPDSQIFVITNVEYIQLSQEQLPNIPAGNIVGEPMMKNTAACILYMTNKIANLDANANVVILPADHLIMKEEAFLSKVDFGFQLAAENDYLITLGIEPTRPDTGYGYIQYINKEDTEIFQVKTFTEKPSLEIAQTFLDSGDFLWNAGIFIWNLKTVQKAFSKFLPDMHKEFEECTYNEEGETSCIARIYPKVAKISIDNGILEKAKNVFVIPADLGWSDLGTWTSVYENAEKDDNANAIKSKYVMQYNSTGTIVRVQNKHKAIVIDGLQDYIVVDTDNALLICPKENDQLIKEYIQDLKVQKNGDQFM
ncbi:mannose-1-phosphate guanylyltransferase [Frigoriflavimonas asaccharolytica]|uniref:mannose-1-phosphate guanylyltransferase n=1 Tax=Frigoriflavimonas asaccharolytica TaxID=2735899 RepID=A0A8J8K728_9FLAO|nr:sugar phosphate nucleotidyltransferase [Frigoriflavimonas asaccharolytica]NRS91081.1 mannose-1-phosphate guanylyltransferase [Frigoriflavimonas asaccharolytica]